MYLDKTEEKEEKVLNILEKRTNVRYNKNNIEKLKQHLYLQLISCKMVLQQEMS